MKDHIQIGDITIDVERKTIKNLHLSVHPPTGSVTISAPDRMQLDTIRVYAVSKLDWIKNQQRKLREQNRETPREYLERESHYLWGKRYLLSVREVDSPPSVKLDHARMILAVRPGTGIEKRQKILERFYRTQLKEKIPELIRHWEPRIGVKVAGFYVQRMKTKWGSCTCQKGTIRLNTELAKKPLSCLEYLIVHEMVHLIEPTHNQRFIALMDHHLPNWRLTRNVLNDLPVRHENWKY